MFVETLLNKGADKEAKDRFGRMLHAASWCMRPKDDGSSMPLHWAAIGGYQGVMQLLLNMDAKGRRRISLAAHRFTCIAAIEGMRPWRCCCLTGFAEKEARDNSGRMSLHSAIARGYESVARLLRKESNHLVHIPRKWQIDAGQMKKWFFS
ncbi:hypothetical protein BGZ61DRAFT_487928 [Ilyonectria robusta]|uniref:uncharacterized protein n=1 Tax=Ilyonectria robusta TaxID=1079257 RepID=UPI001E8D5CBA|nr:uncharacterized protein BGZ61DRAFT_487928 [Ilyonectria robusta]KAH8649600.1 hypothetical protein BGZ61DRAFT_487928 [Ilyonectria robusta]